MNRRWMQTVIGGLGCSLMLLACMAQKRDDWAINNATIGPDSPIELRAGGAYDPLVEYPVPDGPSYPLKARIAWSIAPAVKGISIDAKSGKISVDPAVAHGATTMVYADVDHGRRTLQAKLIVFRPEVNPLIGTWSSDALVSCGGSQQMKSPEPGQFPFTGLSWRFHIDRQFWIGRPIGIRAGASLSGSYEFDEKKQTMKLLPKWPPNQPASSWKYSLETNGKKLLLQPMEAENGSGLGCSYVLHSRS